MVDYKKTGKYVQTPAQDPTDIYVGKPEEVDYSGKSTRIDDNFTYIASQIGGPEKYHPGVGLTLTASGGEELDTFNIDTSYLNSFVATAITGKQDTLVPGANIDIDENNVISIYGISQYQEATSEDAGLMSAEDKAKLDAIDEYANNYVLPIATLESLGGIIVGDNLTIDNGVLSAVNNEYFPVESGSSTPGLLTGADKDKLDSIFYGATKVVVDSSRNADGYISINNNLLLVYRHPAYNTISGTVGTGKFIDGITVDEWGHVTSISSRNESGITVDTTSLGNIVTGVSYDTLESTLDIDKEYLGAIQIGVLDTTTVGTSLSSTDHINTVIRKLQNSIAQVNNDLSDDIASKLQYKGTITAVPNNAANGDLYKAVASFNVGADSVVNGDILIYNNSSWVKIPSGEKSDTWRPVYVGSTQVLSSDDGLPLRITGSGATIVSYSGGNIVVYTPEGSGGGGGTGTITYSPGEGLTLDAESTSTHKIFDVVPATSSSIGGVIVGTGINLDAGVISVPVISGDGTSVNVNNGVVSLVRGQNTAAQVPEGTHSHQLVDLYDIDCDDVSVGQILEYVQDAEDPAVRYWSNRPKPTQYEYTSGSSNVTVNNTSHTISVTPRAIAVSGASTPAIDPYDTIVFAAGDGIQLTKTPATDPYDESSITTITITNTGGSSSSTTVYVPEDTIKFTDYDNTKQIGLKYSNPLKIASNNLTLNYRSNAGLNVHSNDGLYIDYDTNTLDIDSSTHKLKAKLRPITVNGSSDTLTGYTTINFVGAGGTTVSRNGGTITITSTNSGTGPTYSPGSGIDISNNEISVKVSSTTGNALSVVDGYLYVAPDTDTTYSAAANGGLLLNNNNAFSVNIDNSTIKHRSGTLYVDHAEQTSGYVENNSSSPTYTSSTAASDKIQNNTIYKFTDSTTISSITVNVGGLADNFQYATICFKTKSTGTTWSSDFRCIGFDCAVSGGTSVFTPLANTEYQIAIDKIDTVVTGYVLRIG